MGAIAQYLIVGKGNQKGDRAPDTDTLEITS